MESFLIIPAIDLKGGRCVRLRQGRAEDERVYSDDPVAMARHWERDGAPYLHIVDLDGAFSGHPVHSDVIARIAGAVRIPVEVGGGLRTEEDIRSVLERGAARAIVGTGPLTSPDDLAGWVERFGSRLAVGIDARGGRVQIKGWVETAAALAADVAERMCRLGVQTIIYTDTAVDGMMTGPNARAVAELCDRVTCAVIASGGISSAEDIRALKQLNKPNLVAAIVGKALYEGKVTVRELTVASLSDSKG